MQGTKEDIVKHLQLIPHPEGGYFRETYRSGAEPMLSRGQTDAAGDTFPAETISGPGEALWKDPKKVGEDGHVSRNLMTSIYYLMTSEKPILVLIQNEADCVHYWHGGGRIMYLLISPTGEVTKPVLGPDVAAGDTMQLLVKGGYGKGAWLLDGAEWGLIGEAVAPGFDRDGHKFLTEDDLKDRISGEEYKEALQLVKGHEAKTFDAFYDASTPS